MFGAGSISCDIFQTRESELAKWSVEVTEEGEGRIIYNEKIRNGRGVSVESVLRIIPTGGSVRKVIKDSVARISIKNADKVELRLVAATDYRGESEKELCRKYLAESGKKNHSQLFEAHRKDYGELFSRVELTLPKSEASELPTDKRVARLRKAYNNNEAYNDPDLEVLYFEFGRYLLISSSREGGLPANLQGLWADGMTPPWNADYHTNINTQMNYWPSEVTNLSECHLPYLNFISELRENGRKTARVTYNAGGFVTHHTTDVWHLTGCFGAPEWGMWPMGAAWASTHYWEHYLFSKDLKHLFDLGFPVMMEAAEFLSDIMAVDPATGLYLTGPSISPENVFITKDGEMASVCMGPAMDLEITRHLYNCCIGAYKVLSKNRYFDTMPAERVAYYESLISKIETQLAGLTPVKIDSSGRISEWSDESLKEAMPGHRHISHLYGLYPSQEFNYESAREYMAASEKVLEERLAHGGGHTGWSRAWIINFYARLRDGVKAHDNLTALLALSTLPNMLDNHPPSR